MNEMNRLRAIMLGLSTPGVRLFRNNCGALKDADGRLIRYGVANPGGSDLIGWRSLTVTPDMVGRKLAVFLAIEVKHLAHAAQIANTVAPEHLELLVTDTAAKKLTADITTAGAIMIGNFTPTALGDFVAGPSHVLPTGRAGRFFSGLRVDDFMRRTSIVHYDQASVKKAAPIVAAFAAMEKLDAHGRSVRIRGV